MNASIIRRDINGRVFASIDRFFVKPLFENNLPALFSFFLRLSSSRRISTSFVLLVVNPWLEVRKQYQSWLVFPTHACAIDYLQIRLIRVRTMSTTNVHLGDEEQDNNHFESKSALVSVDFLINENEEFFSFLFQD